MNTHESINYIELPANDLDAVKNFFKTVFGWTFVDYGPEYVAFFDAGIKGGFYKSDMSCSTERGSVLVVFYSEQIHQTLAKIEAAGGVLVKPIFSFPGGRRFHFSDPNGNEYAVWTDVDD